MFGAGPRGPNNTNNSALWGQFRSQSLPRLASATAADDLGPPGPAAAAAAGAAAATIGQQQQQQKQQALAGSSNGAAAAAGSSSLLSDGRFARAAKTVGECLGRVKTLSESVNSAGSFRESCSQVLGAAFAASLALQELLSGHCNSKERDLLVQRYAAELQGKLLSAETLVLKYGHEGWWHRLTRFEGKAAVAAKFTQLQTELHDISSNIWDLIDPQNRVKRNVHDPEVGKMLTTGNAFSRHTLRQGGGGSKVSALVAFPEDSTSSSGNNNNNSSSSNTNQGQGQDGMVVWAGDNTIKMTLPSSQCNWLISGAGTGLSCLLHDARGFLWAGYSSGCVAVYSIDKAAVAAEKLAVADATITALALDPQTGHCWAGTEEGVVVIVSFTLHMSNGVTGKLDHVGTLMAPGAGLPPTASTVNSASSSPTAASSAAGGFGKPGGGGGGAASTVSSRRQGGGGGNTLSSSTSASGSRGRRDARRQQKRRQQQYSVVSDPTTDDPIDAWSDWLGGTMHSVAASSSSVAGRSQRFKEVAVHAGRVNAIVIHAGRAYTAGGSSAFNSTLLVWCTETCRLLRVISRRSTAWLRSPITCMTLVHWASTRRAGSASSTGAGMMAAAVVPAGSGGSGTAGLSQFSSAALQSLDGSTGGGSCAGGAGGSGINLHVNINSGAPSTATIGAAAAAAGGHHQHTRSGSASLPDLHLVTGHVNGSVVVWDPTSDDVQPVLLVGPDSVTGAKKCVKSIVLLEELGVLACGHSNGRVYMRKLDPKVPLLPRDDGGIGRWSPATFCLQAHRLGLSRMVGHGHMIITAGKTGSIKLWPETTIRCLASEANVQLPYSRNPISEAVNSLLHRAGMMSSLPSICQPMQSTGSSVTSGQRGSSGSAFLPQQQQQQSAFAAAAAAAGGGAAAAAGAATRQPQPQQQQQDGAGAGGGGGDADGSGGGYFASSDRLRAANWVIDWSQLHMDVHNRRTWLGEGSYGRVQKGCFNQTDVAVKVLTDVGGSSSSRMSHGAVADGNGQLQPHHSAATWDKVRLEKLLQEAGILSTLRHPNVVLFMGVCLSPPAVVTEYCPLRSLYDVLKKANSDPALAARLSWQRRLRMALDAAKGMLHLHNHKPTILHRDLKSPNLFVLTSLGIKVGDFNLSRYMALDKSYVQSSLELNPRWSAPEVIKSGHYSTAADVFSFGVVLWELLSWQEPWAEEELSSYAIMTAVQQEGLRPQLPPLDQLPGQVGPAAAVAAYKTLMEACWAQNPVDRPSFDQVVDRLKALLIVGGPNQFPGTKSGAGVATAGSAASSAAGGAGGGSSSGAGLLPPPPSQPPPLRGVSESAAMAAAAAAIVAAQASGDGAAAGAATPAAAAAAAAAGVGPGGCNLRSRSAVVGGTAGAGGAGPETADLLQLDHGGVDDDGLPGPTRPRPPPAALPPIPGTSDELLHGSGGGGAGRDPRGSSASGSSYAAAGAVFLSSSDGGGGSGGGAGAGAAPLPPRAPPTHRGPSGNQAAGVVAAAAAAGAAAGRAPVSAQSPFAVYTEEEPFTARQQQQQLEQQQQHAQAAAVGAAGFSGSPFASQTAQQEAAAAGSAGGGSSSAGSGGGVINPPRGSEEGAAVVGGGSGSYAVTPRSSTGGGGQRTPSAGIRPSPFASTFAAAALVGEGCSSGSVGNTQGASQDGGDGFSAGGSAGAPVLGLGSGNGQQVFSGGSVTSPLGSTLPVVNELNVGARLDAAVDAASAVAADDPVRRARTSGSGSGGGIRAGAAAAAVAAPGVGGSGYPIIGSTAGGVPDLISLDSESTDAPAVKRA